MNHSDVTEAVPDDPVTQVSQESRSGDESGMKEAWAKAMASLPLKSKLFLGGAALVLLGIGFGAGFAASIPGSTAMEKELRSQWGTTFEERNEWRAEALALRKDAGAAEAQQAEFDERAEELDELEKSLEDREKEVDSAEKKKASNEMTSGFHTVGKTVQPGVYDTTVSSGMCYYAWKEGTGAAAGIIDNNIVESGPATVTLVEGQFFENEGCGTWTKQ
ncbi:hypothetical protein [Leucobacter sp. GX24907]